MQLSKLIRSYWWFIPILAISGYYFLTNLSSSTLSQRDIAFAVTEPERITSIQLNSGTSSLLLTKTDGGWVVNSSYPAREEAVDALVAVVTRLRVASPIPLAVSDSLSREIKNQGVRVRVMARERVVREYSLHSTQTLGLQTIGMLKGARSGYQLTLPNYRGDIINLFNLSNSHWRTQQLGIGSIDQLAQMDVEVPGNPEQSYQVSILPKGVVSLTDLYRNMPAQGFDTARLFTVLEGLTALSYDFPLYTLDPQQRGAIIMSEPDYIFTFRYTNGQQEQMKIFPIPVDEYLDEFGRPIRKDLNNIYVSQPNDSSLYQAKYLYFHAVLREMSFFNPNF